MRGEQLFCLILVEIHNCPRCPLNNDTILSEMELIRKISNIHFLFPDIWHYIPNQGCIELWDYVSSSPLSLSYLLF